MGQGKKLMTGKSCSQRSPTKAYCDLKASENNYTEYRSFINFSSTTSFTVLIHSQSLIHAQLMSIHIYVIMIEMCFCTLIYLCIQIVLTIVFKVMNAE